MITLIAYINWYIQAKHAEYIMDKLGHMDWDTFFVLMAERKPIDMVPYICIDLCIAIAIMVVLLVICVIKEGMKEETV